MAATEEQAVMVLHEEGVAASALAPSTASAPTLFVVLKPGQPSDGGQDQQGANTVVKSAQGSTVASSCAISSMLPAAMANTSCSNQQGNLSPEATCKGITVTLDNNSMWNEFYRCKTEMILTKQGRRMFPYCRFRISGMEPFQRYVLAMDVTPADNHRYRWSERRWEPGGKAEPHISGRSFIHPESPSLGHYWMQNPVSFYKLKLTNNTMDQEGHIILHSMHRYLPRLHVIPAEKETDIIQLNAPDVMTFTFPQTEFFAVTAYQNLSITQLKINYNPFAKGFREDAANTRILKADNGSSSEALEKEVKLSKEANTLKNLKSLFAKKNVVEKAVKDQKPSTVNGDTGAVNGDTTTDVESPHKNSCEKRPRPGVFSGLIQEARVKLKRLNPEDSCLNGIMQPKDESSNVQQDEMDIASEDSQKKNLSFTASESAVKDIKSKERNEGLQSITSSETDNHEIEKSNLHPTPVLNTKPQDHPSDKKIVDPSFDEKNRDPSSEKSLDPSSQKNENGPSLKRELKPVGGVEGPVKKAHKRAEAGPLSLLALLLQQHKAKTGGLKPKPKAESNISSSNSDRSCKTDSSSEIVAPLTKSTTPSLNVETKSSQTLTLISRATTPPQSPVTTTDMKTTPLPSTTPLSDTQAVTSLTPSLRPVNTVWDTVTHPVPELAPVSSPMSDLISTLKPISVPVPDLTSGPFTLNNGPTPDLIHGPSTPNASVTTTPPCTSNPVKASNTITDFQHKTESAHEPCSDPSVEIYHEENKLSQDDAPSSPSHAPCSPAFSLLSATPSSPDPEPQSPGPDEGGFSGALQPTESAEGSGAAAVSMPSSTVYQASVQPVVGIKNQKCKSKHRKGGKMTQNDDEEVTEGPVPVPLQPSLEDVEGQLFVSFMSKEALQIHLGNYASNEETAVHLQTTPETTDKMGGVVENIEERIAALEKSLLNDLKLMRHRQVIHPVLQEVGLKLNLLDLILEIDLRYLGVRLPLPPPVRCPGGSLSSSNVRFVSRTGKTTDFTKIKGWRDKFVPSDLTSSEGSTSSDRTQKNLSAFCSDMLDEYLASEGKLIDERAASFSQAAATPVTYQLPTKSTSYVRTLDSVLKKQALSPTSVATSAFSRPFSPPKRSTQRLGPQDSCKSLGNKLAKFSTLAHALSSEPSTVTSDSRKSTLKNKTGLSTTEKSSASSENRELGKSKSKKNGKTKMRPKTLQGHGHLGSGLTSEDGAEESKTGNTRSSAEGGHSSGLPKTLVKLMDVEDGAVWEGKPRTYITEERAAIALSSLITGEGTLNVNPAALRIIKRRAPPCLNDFCRLGCVCASLAQERRHHHCGKPECMLGCGCLRRKVVLLKSSVKEEDVSGEEKTSSAAAEEGESEPKKKKKKKRKAYVLSDPETVPEPALHVKTLWNKKEIAPDPEPIFMPPPVIYPSSPSLDTDQNFESCSPLTPLKKSRMENLDDAESSMTCARTRPISFKKTPSSSIQGIGKENEHCGTLARTMQENQTQKLQEADLLSLAASKRLEIVSNCKWKGTGIRNYVLRVVCERMAQDRLKSPFWVGKYYVQPISQTPLPDEEGSTVTYKVRISQPGLSQNRVQRKEMPADVRNKADLISMIGKRAEKGLPLLSKVAPAGLLIANKKQPGSSAQGLITVNGKQYPQAKLELSQMGALHPANRLAAYITGKAWPTTQSGTKVEKVGTTVSPTKAPPSVTPTTSASKATSVTSTSACAIISVTKPMVTKPTTGKVLSQVVVNQFLSEQQKLPSTSAPQIVESVQKIILPSPSPMATPNIQVATTKPLSTPGTTDGTTSHLKSVPGSPSGLDTLERGKSFVMVPVSVQPTVPTGGPTLPTRPKRPILPQGQKLPLRLVRTSPLGTLFRGPNGQLVRLIPLSQVKSLKANNPVTSSNTVTHFPTPVAPRSAAIRPHITTTATRSVAVPLKRSPGGTATIMSPAVPASSAIQAQSQTPVHSSPSNVTPTPSVTTQSVSPASGQDQVKVTFSNFLSPPKSQGSLGDSGLDAMKVVPQKSCQEPGIIKTTTAKGETPKSHGADPVTDAFMCSSSSSSSLTQGGDQESERAAVCALAGGSVSDLKPSQESETPSGETAPAEVILGDHSYIGGQSNQDTSDDISSAAHPLQIDNSTSSVCESKQLSDPGKVAHETAVSPKGEGGAAALSSNSGSCSLEKEDLDLKVVSDEEAAERAEASEVTPDGKDNEKYADREEGEISSDIMGDSDEYTEDSEDSEDDSDDDIHSVCDSDDGEKSKDNEVTDSVDEDTVDFLDKEDEDAVDVETVEELPEEMRVAPLRTLTSHSEFTTVQHAGRSHEKRALHKRIERMRRYELKERFQNLQRVLGCDLEKTTKYLTLNQARLEISTLLAQTESLKEERKVQEQQQEAYLKRISELSGKSEDSVLLNIQGICKREKSLEIQDQETGEGVAAPSPPTSASHMLIKGEPDMKPPVGRNSGNAHPGREQGEIDSDVTEDSVDLFEESEDSDDDSALVICDSDQEKSKNEGKTCFVFPDIVELTDSEEDEEVEVEVEVETMNENLQPKVSTNTAGDLEKSIYHRKTDKMRRDDLNGRFQNLQHAIGRHDQATKYHTLNKARLEISTLLTQSKNLTEQRRALEHQQVAYLKRISELSGKSVEKQKSPAKLSDALSTCKQTPSVQSPAPSNASSPSPGNSQRPTLNLPSHRTLDSAPNSDSSPAPQISPRNTKAPAPNTSPNRTPDTVVQHLAKRPSFGSVFNYSVQRERTRPNILSRPRSKPGPPAPKAPPIIPVLNAVLPCNQILTISNPLQPIGITEIRGQPTTPGVASVTFAVPAIPHQVLVTNPVPEPQTLKVISGHAVEVNSSDKGIVPPKITSVISVMPPAEKLLVLDKMEVLTPVSVPVHVPVPVLMPRAEQTSKNSPVLERGRVEGDKLAGSSGLKQTLESIVLKASEAAPSRRGEAERKEGKDDGRDPEDETLIDLLNELIFLNQQLNTESSEPTEGTSNLAEIGGVAMGMASEPPAGADKEDDRSLSPLFLRLDEELTTTPTAKDDDAPPVVDDLVKVVFGSEPLPTPGSGVSMATNGHGQHSPTVSVNGETLTPPPLQQMKAGSAATSTDSTDKPKEEAKVSWRPMPKLAPLGLKAVVQAQDATLSINKTPPLKPRNTLPTVNNPQET